MTEKRKLGDYGEKKVRCYLKRKGYRIIDKNYAAKYGEIDVIAKNKDTVLFVEVKTRSENPLVGGAYAVNTKKRQRIIKTAAKYLAENDIQLQPRFDVAEVEIKNGLIKKTKINYIENAY